MGCCAVKQGKTCKMIQNEVLNTEQNHLAPNPQCINHSQNSSVCSNKAEDSKLDEKIGSKKDRIKLNSVKITPSLFTQYNDKRLENDYTVLQKLGEGFYGYVRLAVHKATNQERAVKSIEKFRFTVKNSQTTNFHREFEVLRNLDHPNILRAFESFEDKSYFHLVTEYISGGQLIDYIISNRFFSEEMAANIMKQILSGINYCHSLNIIHRDLQPENLLLLSSSPLTLKIIGFGNSSLFSSFASIDSRFSNISFSAPEVLTHNSFDPSSDSWSCGVILFLLLTGKLPFYGRSESELKSRVIQGDYSLKSPEWAKISEAAKDLVKNLMCSNTQNRISIKDALNHPWIAQKTHSNQDILSLKNLSSFRFGQKFQQAISMFIASNLVSKEFILKLNQEFRLLDQNGDGKISKDELLQAYLKVMDHGRAMVEVDKVMKSIDSNESGFIDYSEFVTACLKADVIANQENLDLAFKRFDADGNGKLTADEIQRLLGTGLAETENVKKILEEVDSNGDGEIDLKEFQEIMFRQFSY